MGSDIAWQTQAIHLVETSLHAVEQACYVLQAAPCVIGIAHCVVGPTHRARMTRLVDHRSGGKMQRPCVRPVVRSRWWHAIAPARRHAAGCALPL
jgi:hypothetical protein